MKALKSISALLLLSMLAVGVTSCSDGGSGESTSATTPKVTLPELIPIPIET